MWITEYLHNAKKEIALFIENQFIQVNSNPSTFLWDYTTSINHIRHLFCTLPCCIILEMNTTKMHVCLVEIVMAQVMDVLGSASVIKHKHDFNLRVLIVCFLSVRNNHLSPTRRKCFPSHLCLNTASPLLNVYCWHTQDSWCKSDISLQSESSYSSSHCTSYRAMIQ